MMSPLSASPHIVTPRSGFSPTRRRDDRPAGRPWRWLRMGTTCRAPCTSAAACWPTSSSNDARGSSRWRELRRRAAQRGAGVRGRRCCCAAPMSACTMMRTPVTRSSCTRSSPTRTCSPWPSGAWPAPVDSQHSRRARRAQPADPAGLRGPGGAWSARQVLRGFAACGRPAAHRPEGQSAARHGRARCSQPASRVRRPYRRASIRARHRLGGRRGHRRRQAHGLVEIHLKDCLAQPLTLDRRSRRRSRRAHVHVRFDPLRNRWRTSSSGWYFAATGGRLPADGAATRDK